MFKNSSSGRLLVVEPIPTKVSFSINSCSKHKKINVTVPGYEDDVVNDEILELLPVDELLVQAFPLVLCSRDVWEKSVENISDVLKCRLHIGRYKFENSCHSSSSECTIIYCIEDLSKLES
jgi:hypothetical protein